MTELEAMYGSGTHCFSENECYDLEGFESIIDNSRDPDELLKAWNGWREIGKPMKDKYLRMVDIGNQGAQDLVMMVFLIFGLANTICLLVNFQKQLIGYTRI